MKLPKIGCYVGCLGVLLAISPARVHAYANVVLSPVATKVFAQHVVPLNGSTTMSIGVTNPNAFALPGVNFIDTLPAGLVIANPNNFSGVINSTPNACTGGTVTATAGSNTVSFSGFTILASLGCFFTVDVTGTTPGLKVNTFTVSAPSQTTVLDGSTATDSLDVVAPDVADVFQIRYLANLNQGDSYVNFTNAGTLSGFDPAGRICVNVYTFDPAEELISCCACPVTPNGLNSVSARNDLVANTLTPGTPNAITVKLLASVPVGGVCNASTPTAANLVRGMRAWATTLHLNSSVLPAPGVYQHTETEFSRAELSDTELTKLTSYCGFIQSNGSGFGICKSCRFGALGAGQK